jgi:phosphonate transport system permease protein
MAIARDRAASDRSTVPPWTRQRISLAALAGTALILVVAGWHEIGMGLLPLFTGIGNIFRFLSQTVPPQFTGFGHIVDLALVTVCMAVVGTTLAAVMAIPVGFMAARNTTLHPLIRWLARSLIVVCRSVPDLVFAIVFVEAIGIGILPGVLALGFHSVGMLGKLYAEAIEQVEPEPREAVTATGASRLQNVATSVVPQVLPSFSSITLYRLDINLRSSVVLGYVGAGGIGFLLNEDMGELQFRQAVGIVVVIFALIVIMEIVSAIIRQSLIGTDAPIISARPARRPGLGDRVIGAVDRRRLARRTLTGPPTAGLPPAGPPLTGLPPAGSSLAGPPPASFPLSRASQAWRKPARADGGFDPERVRPPWTRQRLLRFCFAGGAPAAIAGSVWVTRINPVQVVSSARQIWVTVVLYFPPDFSTDRAMLFTGILQSASVAMVATAIGFLLAVPIGLLAARNVTDRWIYRAARVFLLMVRAVPELILAIVFVVAVGLGLVAGTFALIVGTIGFMSKLVADGIEEVNPMPREAVLSGGASRLQETATSVLLPAAPALVGSGLYMLDVNFRSSTILGIVGGGGIGFLLYQSVQVLAYRTTGAIIVATFAVVLLIEVITNWVRKRLI